jgi:hypothetical protein
MGDDYTFSIGRCPNDLFFSLLDELGFEQDAERAIYRIEQTNFF